MKGNKVLAVIPARGGSKGIPRKNMRLMNGKPLIAYAIENALAVDSIDAVLVSSDSEEILSFAAQYEGVIPMDRETSLAQDAVTLDPVIYDAVVRYEAEISSGSDVVVTLQPTSPLLKPETLADAIGSFLTRDVDSLISVVNAPHLSWKENGGKIIPAYSKRLNRQQLPPNYLETGAFFITRRECMSEDNRLGKVVEVYEVPEEEATDIDTKQDWVVCEALLSRKKIAFRVDGHKTLGMGHIYRTLALAYELTEHEVVFLCDSRYREGIEKLRASFMPVVEIDSEEMLFEWLETNNLDIFVHDCLDTSLDYIQRIKRCVDRVVTFEDLGDGATAADAVVNALYEGASSHRNVYTGKNYVALRDEFLTSKPNKFSEIVKNVLVTFGGTDPSNLTKRIYELARRFNKDEVRVNFDFILGPGYSHEVLYDDPKHGIAVKQNAVRVSDYLKKADLAFCSQGRTTFEMASMGVPTIVLAQNERELLHRFAQMDNGFINLGLGGEVSDEDIQATFEWLMNAVSIRREMRRLMLNNDLKSGITRVKRIILGETL